MALKRCAAKVILSLFVGVFVVYQNDDISRFFQVSSFGQIWK